MEYTYVAGERGRPIPEQAPEAFRRLESKLPSLKGRRFYGVELDDEYRGCVGIIENDDLSSLPHPTWVIPGGKYVRRKIKNWEENTDLIGPAFEELHRENDTDPSRPYIEYYRSQRELFLMIPVR